MLYRKYLFSAILILTSSFLLNLTAQVQSLNHIRLADNTSMTITGNLLFSDDGGEIITAKEACRSHIGFVEGSSWTNASDAQFIDGTVKVMHSNPFIFPIGGNGKYHPIAITGGLNTKAAYIAKNPSKISAKADSRSKYQQSSTDIAQVKENGYWLIEGQASTSIAFAWNASDDIAALTDGDLERLRILGYKGGEWQIIPSSFEGTANTLLNDGISNSLSNGTISTSTAFIPNDFDYYTLGAVSSVSPDTRNNASLSLYPNPVSFNDQLTVEYQLQNTSGVLQLISASGKILAEQSISNGNGKINSLAIPSTSGVYTVRVVGSEGVERIEKLIVTGY